MIDMLKMELIIDANILMSALIAIKGITFNLIFDDNLKLFAPEYLLEEIEKHKGEILEKSGLSSEEFKLLLSLVSIRINFVLEPEFEKFIVEAKAICPDENDTEYFALALKLNCGIWSNDKELKKQDKIKVYSTEDLISLLEKE